MPEPGPVFLLSPARSYSTVTVAMLAGHPGLFAFPELLSFPVRTLRGLLDQELNGAGQPRAWGINRVSGILRALAQLHDGEQSDNTIRSARDWFVAHGDWTTHDLLDYLLDRVAPAIGVEKSPDTVNTDEGIKACVTAYPNARFLHLTRHPVTTQRSMRGYWARIDDGGQAASLAVTSAKAWYWGHRRIVRTLDTLPRDQWLRVRAEDLLRAPEDWLPRILRWLGLDWSPDIVAGMLQTERWVFAGRGDGQWLGGGDQVFLAEPRLRTVDLPPSTVEFESELGIPLPVVADMRELAEQLGYR